MNIFRKKKMKNIFIIGCSRFGAMLADTFCQQDYPVTVLDHDENAFSKLPYSFCGLKQCAEAADLEDLQEAKIDQADEVYVLTKDDCTNMLCALMIHFHFPDKRILVRLNDSSRQIALYNTTIEAICPDEICLEKSTLMTRINSEILSASPAETEKRRMRV